jgi:hypothetical protein
MAEREKIKRISAKRLNDRAADKIPQTEFFAFFVALVYGMHIYYWP